MYSAFVRSLSLAGFIPVLCTLLFLISSPLFAQLTEVPVTPNKDTKLTFAITAPDGSILFFYPEKQGFYLRFVYKKIKNGVWDSAVYNFIPDSLYYHDKLFFQSVVLPSGRIYCLFKSLYYYGIWSDDNGSNWSSPVKLPLETNWVTTGRVFYSMVDNALYLFAKRGNTKYIKSTNNGESWTAHDSYPLSAPGVIDFYGLPQTAILTITTGPYYSPLALNVNYHDTVSSTYIRTQLNEEKLKAANPVIHSGPGNLLTVYFEQSDLPAGEGITSTTVYYRTSSDNGKSWAPSKKLTSYLGENSNFNLSSSGTVYTLYSTRGEDASPRHYIGNINNPSDEPSPPVIGAVSVTGTGLSGGKDLIVSAFVVDNDIKKVSVNLEKNYGPSESAVMHDDGTNGDQTAGDNIYSYRIPNLAHGNGIAATIRAEDKNGNVVVSAIYSGYFTEYAAAESDIVNIGNFSLSVQNGAPFVGSKTVTPTFNSAYKNSIALEGAGFVISGKLPDRQFAFGHSYYPLLLSFDPGTQKNYPGDPRNSVFKITSNDTPFGFAWQNYRFAVETGAEFYDGNKDGIYTPIDLNGNGKWDYYEDAPLLIGDVTTYMASKEVTDRYFWQDPVGFSLQTNLFGWNKTDTLLGGLFFVRYRLTYTGSVPAVDSAYFSFLVNGNIGLYYDDLVGSDAERQAGYMYNSGSDNIAGDNPPALMVAAVFPPQSYEPGISYTDVNNNNIYDPGTDIPLDSVILKLGPLYGEKIKYGAAPAPVSSVTHAMNSHILINYPNDEFAIRNMQKVGTVNGIFNPCSWTYGIFNTPANCQNITPSLLYSGKPEDQTGWLNRYGTNQILFISFGPFRMERNKPVDIIGVYAAAEAEDAFSSVGKARRLTDVAHGLYQSNFVNAELNTGSNAPVIYPLEFSLSQNYPNPFNPETTIRFNLPQSGMVRLEIFNILGESQKLVINEFMHLGEYSKNINLTGLPSGVYIYRLTTAAASITKKMLYMK